MRNDLPPLAPALPVVLDEVFPHSRPWTRTAMTTAATIRTYGPGEAIINQGDESSLALVLDGYVALRRTTPDGRQVIMRVVDRGEMASMLPLAARPAAADAVALTHTPVAKWRGPEIRSLAEADAAFAIELMDHVLLAFEEMAGRLEGLLYQDAPRRVARVLHRHADLFFSDAPVLTRRHLPMLVGTSREMTGRVLRVLESRGLVAREGRHGLRLLDPAGLAAAAEPREERRRTSGRDPGGPGP